MSRPPGIRGHPRIPLAPAPPAPAHPAGRGCSHSSRTPRVPAPPRSPGFGDPRTVSPLPAPGFPRPGCGATRGPGTGRRRRADARSTRSGRRPAPRRSLLPIPPGTWCSAAAAARVRQRRARGSAGRGGARSPVPGRSRRGGAGRGAEPRDGERAREPSPGALGEPRSRYRERCGGCAPRCRGPPVCRCCCAGQRSAGWPRGCGTAWIPEGESVGVWSICFAPENSLQSPRSPGLAVGARCFPAATFGGLCPIPRSSRGEAGALGHQQQSHLSLNSPLWSAWSWQGLAWGCNGAPSPPEPRRKLRQGWKEPAAPGMGGGAQCPVLPSQGSRHGQSLG